MLECHQMIKFSLIKMLATDKGLAVGMFHNSSTSSQRQHYNIHSTSYPKHKRWDILHHLGVRDKAAIPEGNWSAVAKSG